jgi:hypothetical protein
MYGLKLTKNDTAGQEINELSQLVHKKGTPGLCQIFNSIIAENSK